MHTHVHIRVYICLHRHIRVYIYVHPCVYTNTFEGHAHIHACVRVRTWMPRRFYSACRLGCMYVDTGIYTHTYPDTHRHEYRCSYVQIHRYPYAHPFKPRRTCQRIQMHTCVYV